MIMILEGDTYNPPFGNWRRLVENEWDNQQGEFRFEREHQFPINDDTLGMEEIEIESQIY